MRKHCSSLRDTFGIFPQIFSLLCIFQLALSTHIFANQFSSNSPHIIPIHIKINLENTKWGMFFEMLHSVMMSILAGIFAPCNNIGSYKFIIFTADHIFHFFLKVKDYILNLFQVYKLNILHFKKIDRIVNIFLRSDITQKASFNIFSPYRLYP